MRALECTDKCSRSYAGALPLLSVVNVIHPSPAALAVYCIPIHNIVLQ
jgi:hypothetical protein